MSYYKKLFIGLLMLFLLSFVLVYAEGGTNPKIPKKYLALSESKRWDFGLNYPWIVQDNNNDGKPDSAIIISSKYNKVQENMDLNYDGYADDFAYFNKDGEIIFQEIDSNYDHKVDIWIEIDNGVSIISIQQDEDFDGLVDKAKNYREE